MKSLAMNSCYSIILFSVCLSFASGSRFLESRECSSPQYAEVGKVATIRCSFAKGFVGLFWYNTTNFVENEAILTLRGYMKGGNGYTSGNYDILPDGSLVIKNFSKNHERTFTVLKFESESTLPTVTLIDVFISPSVSSSEEKLKTSNNKVVPILVGIFIGLVVVLTAVIILVLRNLRPRNFHLVTQTILMVGDENNNKTLLEDNSRCVLPDFSKDEELHLIESLKLNYKNIYNTVRRVPYLIGDSNCINEIYVDACIEYYAGKKSQQGNEQWEKLSSYKQILSDPRVQSNIRILEGEAGYGKSTLTLKLLFDWCSENFACDNVKIDMLIYLTVQQLEGASLYTAIRRFLLPSETTLSERKVEAILRKCSSVLVVLDGFDEYPFQHSFDRSDLFEVIKDISIDFQVILTSRSSFIPKEFPSQTKRIRITGFDTSSQEKYIKGIVAPNNESEACRIERQLQQIPGISDLCRIPLLFALFSHALLQKRKTCSFKNLTTFIDYIISCFGENVQNRIGEIGSKDCNFSHCESILNDLSFDTLTSKDENCGWTKGKLVDKLGYHVYDAYVKTGILFEKKLHCFVDLVVPEKHQMQTEVLFYHKIICEFYAARHLALFVSKNGPVKKKVLKTLDPTKLHYFFLFACGLSPATGSTIVEFLRGKKESLKVLQKCITELITSTSNPDVLALISNEVTILSGDDIELQKLKTETLQTASNLKVSIGCLKLKGFGSYQFRNEALILSEFVSLSKLDSLRSLVICSTRDLRNESVDILRYSGKCINLKKIEFEKRADSVGDQKLLLPFSFKSHDTLLTDLSVKKCEVLWTYEYFTSPYERSQGRWRLNLKSGRWIDFKGKDMTHRSYDNMGENSSEKSQKHQGMVRPNAY